MQYQITRQYNFKNYAILYNTMQYHKIIFNCHTAMPYNTVNCHTMPCNTIQNPSLQHNMYHTIPYNTIQCNAILPLLSVKYVCLISQETNCLIVIPKSVLKSVLWRGLEFAFSFWQIAENNLKSEHDVVSNLPLLSVKYICLISQKTNTPILIPKTVLKSVLWCGSECAFFFWHFQVLCFSLRPNTHTHMVRFVPLSHPARHGLTNQETITKTSKRPFRRHPRRAVQCTVWPSSGHWEVANKMKFQSISPECSSEKEKYPKNNNLLEVANKMKWIWLLSQKCL